MYYGCCLLGFLMVLLVACGGDSQPKVESSAPPAVISVDPITLDLRPENPQTTGCLEAITLSALPAEGLRWIVNGQIIAGQTGTRLCREFFRRGDEVTVQMQSGGKTLSRALKAGNAPPRISEVTFSADATTIGVNPTAVDADGDRVELRYEWVINGEVDPALTGASVPRSRFRPDDKVQIRITPYDGTEDGPAYASRQFAQPNSPPRIVSNPPDHYDAYQYVYQVRARDVDNDPLTFALVGPPEGMKIGESSGKISWPLKDVFAGKYKIVVVVRDPGGGEARQEFVLNLPEPAEQ